METLNQSVPPTYRYPKLEQMMNWLGALSTTLMISAATYGMFQWFGRLVAFAIIFLYMLITKMRSETIYFYDDKGLGPGRLLVFISNTSVSFKNALVQFAIASIIDFIVRSV